VSAASQELPAAQLLGPAEVRQLAARAGVIPTKQWGQNFVHDPNTVRRIAKAADLDPADVVVEVGPGLGSLTLALLPRCVHVFAVEIDARLAAQLPGTVAERASALTERLTVLRRDALTLTAADFSRPPTALVANLPYNVAVPVVLHLLATLPTLTHGLVMVQKEVADRLTAAPGTRIYGVPSAKLAWFATATGAGRVPPNVFWPVPNVDSGLVAFACHAPPLAADRATREDVFAVIDAAFGQRRKMVRGALAAWAGSAQRATDLIEAAGVSATVRGESLTIEQFSAIAAAKKDRERTSR
jgi:16S rRNA (adenine1518-N6/adenine1519-N6)-dimethyltransferase